MSGIIILLILVALIVFTLLYVVFSKQPKKYQCSLQTFMTLRDDYGLPQYASLTRYQEHHSFVLHFDDVEIMINSPLSANMEQACDEARRRLFYLYGSKIRATTINKKYNILDQIIIDIDYSTDI